MMTTVDVGRLSRQPSIALAQQGTVEWAILGSMRPRTRLEFLRPFTTNVFNRVSRPFAGWLPGFGILLYRGRKTGKAYRTPMNVFRQGDEYILALTYGSDVQWVKNVLAAGGTGLISRGRTIQLVDPEVFVDPERASVPQPVRFFLGLMNVTEFMRLKIAAGA